MTIDIQWDAISWIYVGAILKWFSKYTASTQLNGPATVVPVQTRTQTLQSDGSSRNAVAVF